MTKNRYFKNTMGNFSELAIAAQVDAADGTAATAEPATAQVLVTIAADPTPGDLITITVDGVAYTHTVPGGDETTQQAHDAIAALLAGNNQGFLVVGHSGTTSSIYNLAWAGADKNTKAIALAETGSSFTVAGPYAFAGGVDADATASDNIKDFVTNALAGSIWAFWDDTHLALKAGDTALAANKNRKFYYAWKQGVATEYNKSTSIPVDGMIKDKIAYNAGAAEVRTVAASTGTYSVGQYVHVRVINTTPTNLPYESFDYSTPIVTNIDAAWVIIAAAINAENLANTPIVTATSSTTTLTLTAKDKYTTFKVIAYMEPTAAYPTDASIFVLGLTTNQKPPIGDIASVTELQKYYIMNNGGLAYGVDQPGVVPADFGQPTTNVGLNSVTQYGFLLYNSKREEAGVVRNTDHKAYLLIAIKNTDLDTLYNL